MCLVKYSIKYEISIVFSPIFVGISLGTIILKALKIVGKYEHLGFNFYNDTTLNPPLHLNSKHKTNIGFYAHGSNPFLYLLRYNRPVK